MDYVAAALALIQAIQTLTATATNLIDAAKANGDPLPQEVADQLTASAAARARLHAAAGIPA